MRILARLEGDVDLSGSFGRRLKALEGRILLEKIVALSHPLHATRVLDFYHSYRYRLPPLSSPDGGPLALILAQALWKHGDQEQALSTLDQILQGSPSVSLRRQASLQRFDWLMASHRENSALDWALKNLREKSISRQDRTLWFSRAARLTAQQGKAGTERKILREWLSSGTPLEHRGPLMARLGLLDLSSGKDREGEQELLGALPDLRNGSGNNTELSDVLFHLGQIAWARGDKTKAEAYWQEQIQCCHSDRRNPWIMYQMGKMALLDGDRTRALAWFQKAVKASGGRDIGKVARLKIKSMELEKNGGKQ